MTGGRVSTESMGTAAAASGAAVPAAGRVFRRATDPHPIVAVRGRGSEIWDAAGRRYLDAAGGAVVVNVGHGRESVVAAMSEQATRLAYAHGSAFTTEAVEEYAAAVGPHLPMDAPAIYPVSGGSEAVESALKLVRAYHLARREPNRLIVMARWGSYHGNTLGALDLSGRRPLRRPYEPWLGRFRHLSAAYPYRDGYPGANALGDATELSSELDRAILAAEPGTVAAFIAEPVVGATLGAVEPPPGYWPAIAEVCRRHGVLLVADEVMTGFGRTGRWFAIDHWGVRPDIVVAAKGATSGYWPFGFAAASGEVFETVTERGGFVHGFTFSHSPVGAAVALEVLRIIEREELVARSAVQGDRLLAELRGRLSDHPNVGEIRGRGLMAGVELVEDRETRTPFDRSLGVVEQIVRSARADGLLLYSGTGNANGVDGDVLLLGPPFTVSDAEIAEIGAGLERAIAATMDALPAIRRLREGP